MESEHNAGVQGYSNPGKCAATGSGSPGTRKGLRGEGLNEEADARARRITQECGHAAEADALDKLLPRQDLMQIRFPNPNLPGLEKLHSYRKQ